MSCVRLCILALDSTVFNVPTCPINTKTFLGEEVILIHCFVFTNLHAWPQVFSSQNESQFNHLHQWKSKKINQTKRKCILKYGWLLPVNWVKIYLRSEVNGARVSAIAPKQTLCYLALSRYWSLGSVAGRTPQRGYWTSSSIDFHLSLSHTHIHIAVFPFIYVVVNINTILLRTLNLNKTFWWHL